VDGELWLMISRANPNRPVPRKPPPTGFDPAVDTTNTAKVMPSARGGCHPAADIQAIMGGQ